MMTSALFAGIAAGLFAALLHFAFVQKLILLGEQYETGALTHFSNGSDPNTAATEPKGHDHADRAQHAKGVAHGAADQATDGDTMGGHVMGDAPSPTTRNALTVLFTCLVYIAYSLLLIAGFALAENFGKRITAREGVLWGIAGFVTFQLMPAMGLAPELPGTIAADLYLRQIWWWGTVAATATGLAMIGYGHGRLMPFALAVILLAAPHIIGAPQADEYWGVAPPELAASFAVRVLGAGFAVWVVLGWLAGYFWSAKTT